MDEYLTVAEVAQRLKVTRQAVYNWIKDGRLRAVKVGTSVRIPLEAVRAFLRPVEPGEHLEEDAETGPPAPCFAMA